MSGPPTPPPPPPPPAQPVAFEIPEVFGRYRILEKLGEGGMGAVYLAQDTQLDRRVALKVPRFGPEDGREVVERFYREARLAAGFNHPNLCPVHDVGQVDGVHYLTMPHIEGETLAKGIVPGKPLPLEEAAKTVRTLALALQEAHARGVVHRDLKPANVMVTRRGELVVMDFGLARRVDTDDTRLTRAWTLLGTPGYMSPEQVEGDPAAIGKGADVYSLGVILYELLTGRLPFSGSATKVLGLILTKPPEPPSAFRPDLDPGLEAVCLKAMEKLPADRYESMAEFAEDLGRWLSGGRGRGGPPGMATTLVAVGDDVPPLGITVADSVHVGRAATRGGGRRPLPPRAALAAALGAAALLLAGAFAVATRLGLGPSAASPAGVPASRAPGKAEPRLTNDLGMALVRIEPGTFTMGSGDDQLERLEKLFPGTSSWFSGEKAHLVRITKPFYLATHEVTVGQFRRFVEASGYRTGAETDGLGGSGWVEEKNAFVADSRFTWRDSAMPQTDEHPVVNVDWNDARAFCAWLTKTDTRGLTYRLPTEAEWEYACRAGTTSVYTNGDDPEALALVGNVADASAKRIYPLEAIRANDGFPGTAPVGSFPPNAWGLFDMIGNVWEWCEDWYHPGYYFVSPRDDPAGPPGDDAGGRLHPHRGGSWYNDGRQTRAAFRGANTWGPRSNRLGFRVAAVPVP